MSVTNPLHETVREWVGKEEGDLVAAAHVLKLGRDCPPDAVGFHAQQYVEKHIKALLVFRSTDFPKVHNLAELAMLLPPDVLTEWPLEEQRTLNKYAVVSRYPGGDVTMADARRAVRIARRVRREIRRLLPAAALRRKRTRGKK